MATVLLVSRSLRTVGAQKWFLLAASCVFYVSWSVPCLFLILFTAVSDYVITRKMSGTTDASFRRWLLVTSLALNLGLLGFFKYANFFLDNVSAALNLAGGHAGPWHLNLILPPAISFYTFASLSYVLDVYYERMPACPSVRDYALFLTFFPKLLSGPIVRARELLPQFQTRTRAGAEEVEIGLSYFLMGAVKKLVIADQVAPHINLIFGAPAQFDGLTLVTAALGYAVQIYCDFSGYTDMAIGCGRILGFRFPDNFKMPYSSGNITEFWRRWHITLSQWFRDYLFLPLEIATRNNPSPMLRVSINMMITMLLCGLWHGASWTFVIWGGIHGAALATHKVWSTWNPLAGAKTRRWFQFLWGGCSHLLTLGVVVLSLVFFRAQSVPDAEVFLRRAFSFAQDGTRLISPYILLAVIVVSLIHLLVQKDRNLAEELPRMSMLPRIVGYASLFLLLVVLGATDSA
ncbi:MAG TPA: MBOAT family O-acyltransferase, partial [Candidatus Acidoferrales bacterium]|nr:MBOAT family O-acyltransferase [Candidatus Acidoferrales bacterium]